MSVNMMAASLRSIPTVGIGSAIAPPLWPGIIQLPGFPCQSLDQDWLHNGWC
jgi:hypothetical protein